MPKGLESLRVACIIPTYNGRRDLERLLSSLKEQDFSFDTFVVDSDSKDGTFEAAVGSGVAAIQISSRDFNHGGTRQMMVERFPSYDVYVFLTQDAYLEDRSAVRRLVAYFEQPDVGAVCGRQLPHLDANLLSRHARVFNYPSCTQIKSIADASQLGIKTAFMSNSFSGYRSEALCQAGGFPKHVILSEDMYVAAKMLQLGWKVVYAGDACCRHSHNYTVVEEFRRYFDVGVFQRRESWIGDTFGGASGEGLRFVKSELIFLGWRRIAFWPLVGVRTVAKFLGFALGRNEKAIPIGLKKRLSMHSRYWSGPYADADGG